MQFNSRLVVVKTLVVIGIMLLGVGTSFSQDESRGGTLSWAFIQKPRSLDPNVWSGGSDNDVMRQIFDPLVWSTGPGEFIPGLATSWDVSEDLLTYTFELRQDVTFHDGSPFNAEAVRFTYERMMDPATQSLQRGNLGPYDRTEVIDEFTVAIHLNEPFAPLLTNLSSTALAPASPSAVAALGDEYSQRPVGTGPFMFDRWQGNDLHLVRNPDYAWAPSMMEHDGPAYLDRIVVREVREASTRMVTLRTGEANFTHFPVFDELTSFEDDGFNVLQEARPGFAKTMPINIMNAPTDDLRVRQAINYGIDKQLVVDLLMFGWADPAYGPLKQSTFGYDPAVREMYNYDPDRAAELLDEAGWIDSNGDGIRDQGGVNLKLDMVMFDSGTNASMAELVQALVTELGFETTLQVTPYDAFAQSIVEGNYNTAEMNWASVNPDLVLFNMFHSSQVTGGGQFNRTRVQSEELDALLDASRQAPDSSVRSQRLSEIQAYVMENALLLPLWDNDWVLIAAPEVKGVVFDPEGRPLFYNFWIDDN